MDLSTVLGMAGFVISIILVVVLAAKIQELKDVQAVADNLRKSLDEMDEQAKLVVRTDMELNKTQEELDKKIGGLYALQRLSRVISTELEESQIFKKIGLGHLEELGFEKVLAFLWDDAKKIFLCQMDIGYLPEELPALASFLNARQDMYLNLIKNEKTISSVSLADDVIIKGNINRAFKVDSFVISPIPPKEGAKGLLFVGTKNKETLVGEGDEELITILANEVGQALENARLFEKTWRSQQDLEKKVEERTRELTLALDEVKKISKRKTDFVSSVSHELRTPLTSIKGYAAILLTGKLGNIPADVRERLDKINRHSDELVHMVNDLLDISRIESGRVTMRQDQLDLRNTIEQAVDLLSVQLKERDIHLTSDIDPNAYLVLADRTQIERVFINIIGNAMKFTPNKGKISIRVHKEDKFVQVDITDTGCGIPREAQDAIFEEFYRVDNTINQQVKGTGLGLALVKNIIEAHKGKIWVKSKEGSGSTFSFTLLAA
jgi:signal transduction histidine kinase